MIANYQSLPNEDLKLAVWNKGTVIAGYDASIYRYDTYGNVMRYADHGDRQSQYGWEIDHILATTLGGSDHISNLRPLHWQINASLGGRLGG